MKIAGEDGKKWGWKCTKMDEEVSVNVGRVLMTTL
jgi:hypothetical protein